MYVYMPFQKRTTLFKFLDPSLKVILISLVVLFMTMIIIKVESRSQDGKSNQVIKVIFWIFQGSKQPHFLHMSAYFAASVVWVPFLHLETTTPSIEVCMSLMEVSF